MKICFFISTRGHGRGGHFYSLRTTARALDGRCDCAIVNIGPAPSPVLRDCGVRFHHVRFRGFDLVRALIRLLRIIRQERPDVLHAFDVGSYFFARLMAGVMRRPVLLTKCGGPTPKKYYPHAENLILYSREDLGYFTRHRKFRHGNIHLLPNRVAVVPPDTARLEKLASARGLRGDCPIVLRIARFSSSHKESILQSIRLTHRLNRDGHRCRLLLVGVPEDPLVLGEITSQCDDVVTMLTEDEYTLNASALLDLADIVVGTGRSLMEAASRAKTLMVPLAGNDYPVLVTPDNFQHFFDYNFSSRTTLDSLDEEQNLRAVAQVLTDERLRQAAGSQAKAWYEEHFAIESVLDRYLDIYRSLACGVRGHPVDFLFHMAMSIRGFARAHSPNGSMSNE